MLNITPEARKAVVAEFMTDIAYRTRIAKSTLGVDTLTQAESAEITQDADAQIQRDYGFSILDLFV